MDTSRLSQDDSRGDEKAGDVRKMCRSLGMAREWPRMVIIIIIIIIIMI